MSTTDNNPDIDSGIWQMGLVVSDAEAEGNELFNKEMDSGKGLLCSVSVPFSGNVPLF